MRASLNPLHRVIRASAAQALARFVVLALCLAALSVPAFARGVRCTASGIKGFESEAMTARRYLPSEPTSLVERATFYLTTQGEFLYVHTNYKELGGDYTTKLSSDESMDLDTVVANIAGGFGPEEGIKRSGTFVVDEQLLSSEKWRALDFSEVGTLSVVKNGTARRARSFRAQDEAPRWVLEYGRGIYVDVADNGAPLVNALRAQPFSRDDIHLISLSANSATVDRVKTIPNAATFTGTSVDALREALTKESGKTLFVLGHIEDDAFVTRNAAGKTTFRIGVRELEQLALECCKVRLFAVGCHSAKTVSRGMLETFNTLRVLEQYEKAVQATTMLEFLERITGGDARLALVVDKALVQEQVQTEVRVIASETPRSPDGPISGEEVARIWYAAAVPTVAPLVGTGGTSDTNGSVPDQGTDAPVVPQDTSDWGCGCVVAVVIVAILLGIFVVRRERRMKRGRERQ